VVHFINRKNAPLLFFHITGDATALSAAWGTTLLSVDFRLLDFWFAVRSLIRLVDVDLVVVAGDDRSAEPLKVGGALYKRYQPELLRRLAMDRTIRVIAFDHDFATASPYDRDFAAALGQTPIKIVVGSGATTPVIAALPIRRGYLGNIVAVEEAGGVAMIARFVRIARTEDGSCMPSFALAAVASFFGMDPDRQLDCGDTEVTLAPHLRIPVDDQYLTLINFVGPTGRIPRVSYVDVINTGADAIRGVSSRRYEIVVVGETSGVYVGEVHHTPFGPMYGAEVQANIIQMLLHGRVIHRLGWESVVGAIGCLALL